MLHIIGVVRDTKYDSVRAPVPPTAFEPFPQQTTFSANFQIRTSGSPDALISTVREQVRKVDRNLPIVRITTQTDLLEGGFTEERFFAMSYSLFGGLGLLIASNDDRRYDYRRLSAGS